MHITRRKTLGLTAVALILVLIIVPFVLLKHNASTPAHSPAGVKIDTPLVLVRGHRCLLTETIAECKARVP